MNNATDGRIVTITLNPSLDRTIVVNFMAVGYRNFTTAPSRIDPGGRGFNVARALHRLTCATSAVVLLGDDPNGLSYSNLLAEGQVDVTVIRREGYTHSNITIWDTGNHNETKIIENESEVNPDVLASVGSYITEFTQPKDVIVLAGMLPQGVAMDTYAWLTEVAHEVGAKVALFAGGKALAHALRAKPDIVAINQYEAEGYLNYPVRTYNDILQAGQQLLAKEVDHVLIALDEGGALLSTDDGAWLVDFPRSELFGTTNGVWDAMLAGYLAGLHQTKPPQAALQIAAAAASFTASKVGSEFGTLSDIQPFLDDVELTPFSPVSPETE